MNVSVKPVEIKNRISRWGLIRFQIQAWCSMRNIQISNSDLDMLSLLAVTEKTELNSFCDTLVKTELSTGPRIKKQNGREKEYKFVFNSSQSARNAISKMSDLGLIMKQGKSHIKICINPAIEIFKDQNVLLTYKLLCIES